MTFRRFSTFVARAVLWGVLLAELCNGIEGWAQTWWGLNRSAQVWLYSAGVYLHAGAWLGLGWGLALGSLELLSPHWPQRWRPADALVPALAASLVVGVGGYWINLWPAMPSFSSRQGKAAMAGLGILVIAVFAMLSLLGARRRRRRHPIGSRPSADVALVLVALGIMVAVAVTWPRASAERTDHGDHRIAHAPPVIVILVDTLRRDHLSCYGYSRVTSPHIDALATDGVLFDESTTSGNFTIPSVASLFTGRYPSGHGVVHATDRIPPQIRTLAERFAAAGYRTGAFVANPTIRAEMGFDRGFTSFYPSPPPSWVRYRATAVELLAARLSGGGDVSETARLVPRAIRWLDRREARPPFLYLHLIDPHSGYVPPREDFAQFLPAGVGDGPAHPPRIEDYEPAGTWTAWEDLPDPPSLTSQELAGMVARYDGEIHYVDRWVGRVLDHLRSTGLYEKALVVFLADHGEEFGDHGGWFHGRTLYGEMVNMPLVMKLPGNRGAGLRTHLGVHMVDLAGTIGGLVGIPPDSLDQGRDRSAELMARVAAGIDPPEESDGGVAYTERPPFLFSLRLGSWKIIQRSVGGEPRYRLFDLRDDPRERHDRVGQASGDFVRLQTALHAFMARASETTGVNAESQPLDPETERVLRSLGYTD